MRVCELTPAPSSQDRQTRAVTSGTGKARTLRGRLFARMWTGIVLRAVAIVFIVSTHFKFFDWEGLGDVLMALAGYNFARFQLSGARKERLLRQLRTIGPIVLPSVVVIAVAFVLTDDYGWHNVFLLNSLLGPQGWTDMSRFWFVEVLVHILLGLAVLLAIPAVHRAQRRWPWGFPLALAGVDLLQRFDVVELSYPGQGPVLWLFGLGWGQPFPAALRNVRQRAVVTALALLTIPGSFSDEYSAVQPSWSDSLFCSGSPRCPCPADCTELRLCGPLSSLVALRYPDWLIYPLLVEGDKGFAVLASLAVGVAYWAAATRAMASAERWLRVRWANGFSR